MKIGRPNVDEPVINEPVVLPPGVALPQPAPAVEPAPVPAKDRLGEELTAAAIREASRHRSLGWL